MSISISNATKLAVLAGLIAAIGILWLALPGQSEPVEAAFTPPDACADDGVTANAAFEDAGHSFDGAHAYSYWSRECVYRSQRRWTCDWVYTATSTGSSRERDCGYRTFGWRDCRWILFYR